MYDELRKLARQKMAQENPGQTLQATGLVHEAYLRLVDVETAQHWNSRGHFFGACAEAMRRILVENARRKQQLKHGGGMQRVDLDRAAPVTNASAEELLALEDALAQVRQFSARESGFYGVSGPGSSLHFVSTGELAGKGQAESLQQNRLVIGRAADAAAADFHAAAGRQHNVDHADLAYLLKNPPRFVA